MDSGDRGLAYAAVTGKDVSVRDTILCKRIEKRAGDVILSNNVGETLRTVFAS